MNKILGSSGKKGKSTDKKILQILIDVYKDNIFYNKIYELMVNFFDMTDKMAEKKSEELIKEINIKDKNPFEGIDFMGKFLSSLKLDMGDRIMLGVLINQEIKVKDLETKYKISNVTLKKRLDGFFEFTNKKEGNLKFLCVKPKFDVLIWLILVFYMKEKDIKENNIARRLLNLIDNNL